MGWIYFFQESPRPSVEPIRYRSERRTAFVTAALGGPYGNGLIKIGFTNKSPAWRAAEMASYVKRSIAILGTLHGPITEEARLHRVFRHLCAQGPFGRREWFLPAWELTNFISSLPIQLDPEEIEFDGTRGRGHRFLRAKYALQPTGS